MSGGWRSPGDSLFPHRKFSKELSPRLSLRPPPSPAAPRCGWEGGRTSGSTAGLPCRPVGLESLSLASAAPHSPDQMSAARTNWCLLEVFKKWFSSCERLRHCSAGWPPSLWLARWQQPEGVKSKGRPCKRRPATIPPLWAVWCQAIKGSASGPVLPHHSPPRPPESSQVRGGARRKFATPEGALGVVNSQGGWQERGKFSVCTSQLFG